MRLNEMRKKFPLPWRHDVSGDGTASAVVDANGTVVCGSMICQSRWPAPERQAHALIVEAVNDFMGKSPDSKAK